MRSCHNSLLHWKYNPIKLAELLCALDADDAFCYADGKKATFTDVVSTFEQLFDIRLGEPYDVKRNVLRRKLRLTGFLDELRSKLKDASLRF